MRKILTSAITVLALLMPVMAHGAGFEYDIDALKATGLMLLQIETVGREEPTCDYVNHPEGAMGESITNAKKVPGRLTVWKNGAVNYDSGDYVNNTSGMRIKIRGNTSAYKEKKPYKIDLEKKADLLFRGNESFADKDWVLIDDGSDWFANPTGFKVSELMNLPWVPAYTFVNLILNGDYKGIYMLTEAVKRNADCRIDVDKNTGFIIERDAYWWNEDLYFKSSQGQEYTFKYPKSKNVTPAQLSYINEFVNQMEASIATGTYDEYIDVESFARWLLVHEIVGSGDAGGSNIFLMKKDNSPESKLTFSNVWDLDNAFFIEDKWAPIHWAPLFYFQLFFNSPNKLFRDIYGEKWRNEGMASVNGTVDFLRSFPDSELGKALQASRQYDAQRWNIPLTWVEKDCNKIADWLLKRRQWLEEHIEYLTPIGTITAEKAPSATYSIDGRAISGNEKGIVIRNGKKVIRR